MFMDYDTVKLFEGTYEEDGERVERTLVVEGEGTGLATGARLAKSHYLDSLTVPTMNGAEYDPEDEFDIEADLTADKELLAGGEGKNYNIWLVGELREPEEAIDAGFPEELTGRVFEGGVPQENDTIGSKPVGSNDTGGDKDMTDDEYDVPMTAAHAVAYESHKNLDEHEDVADDELYNLDLDEQVALGAAAVMKGIEEEEYDDFGFVELDEFIDQYGEEFNDEAFKRYKGQMGGNQYDEDIPGNVGDEVDEINRIKQALGTDTVLWEALYREKAADNEESQEVLEGVLEEVSRLDRDDSRLQSSRAGLQIAENTERVQSDKADDIDDLARNL